MARRGRVVTDLDKASPGDVYKAPDGTRTTINRIVHSMAEARPGDIYELPDGSRTLIRRITEVKEAQEPLTRKTRAQKEREKAAAKKPKKQEKKKEEKPRKKAAPKKPEKPKEPPEPRRQQLPPLSEAATGQKSHDYVMCPLCGWWHIMDYRLKPEIDPLTGQPTTHSKRRAAERKRFEFDISLISDAGATPPTSVYHSRIMRGAGRGSKNATVIVYDRRNVDEIPDRVVADIMAQCRYIMAVFSAPKGQRLATAQVWGGLSPTAPTQAPATTPGRKKPARRKQKPSAPQAPPASAQWTPYPNRPRYSAQAAAELLGHVRSLRLANQNQTMSPPEGDIQNQDVYEEYERLTGLLESWGDAAIPTQDRDAAGKVVMIPAEQNLADDITEVIRRLYEDIAYGDQPDLAMLEELLSHLVDLGDKAGVGRDISVLQEELQDNRQQLHAKRSHIRALDRKAQLTDVEEIELRELHREREALEREVETLKFELEDAQKRGGKP